MASVDVPGLPPMGLFHGISAQPLFSPLLSCSLDVMLQTAPPTPHPRIISKLVTLENESKLCRMVINSINLVIVSIVTELTIRYLLGIRSGRALHNAQHTEHYGRKRSW